MKKYGFQLGDERVEIIEANSEKEALHILVDKYWDIINYAEEIELLGEIIDERKITEME